MGNVETKINIKYDPEEKKIIRTANDGYNTSVVKLPAVEIDKVKLTNQDWENIKNEKSREFDFCIIENFNSINECIGLFTNSPNSYAFDLDQYRIEYGSECYSLKFRPGIVIDSKDINSYSQVYIDTIKGNKCKIVYQDFNYNTKDIERCCFTDDKHSCNANLINNFSTNHCNGIMVEKCKDQMDNPICIKWLEQTYTRFNNEALELYENWCSDNFDSPVCDYFCKIARDNSDYRSEYCDRALKYWCKNNANNPKCVCVLSPDEIIPKVEKFLGPKECWLSQCSGEPNNKWLTTDQLDTRKNCALTSCIINIHELNLNDNARVELINDCISGTKVSSAKYYSFIKADDNNIIKKTPGIAFIPELLLTSISLLLLSIIK